MKIRIRHNHGVLTLKDAEIKEIDGVRSVIGTIVAGHSTNRFGWATSTFYEKEGGIGSWPIWGKEPTLLSDGSYELNSEFM